MFEQGVGWVVVWAGVEAGVGAVAIVHHLAVAIVRPLLLAGVAAVAIVHRLLLAEVEAVAIVHHYLLVEGGNLWENLLPFLENLQPKHHLRLVEGDIVHQLHPMAIGKRTDTKLNFQMEFCKEGWQTGRGQEAWYWRDIGRQIVQC